jgi:hypothetical protein
MGRKCRILALIVMLALATWNAASAAVEAGLGKPVPDSLNAKGLVTPLQAPLHGGVLSLAGENRFETVFTAEGLQVYLYTEEGSPAMVEGATGQAVVKFAGGRSVAVPLGMEIPSGKEPAVYFCPMHPEVVQMRPGICEKCGGMKLYTQNRLSGRVDLSRAKPGSVTADVTLQSLSGKQAELSFSVSDVAAKPRLPGSTEAGTKPTLGKPATSGKAGELPASKGAGAVRKPSK